jgi:hypothetical protein
MTVNPRRAAAALLIALAALAPACAQESQGPTADAAPLPGDGPTAYIVNIEDGATVTSPVRVVFGLANFGVAPAGVTMPNTGHHHLLIDTVEVTPGAPLPAIPGQVVHFGGGQTETVVELEPGAHTLMLVLGDANHIPLEPAIQSAPITVNVQ